MTFSKQIKRILFSTSFVTIFVLCLGIFMALILMFANRTSPGSLYSPFSRFDSSNLAEEIAGIDSQISDVQDLMSLAVGDETRLAVYQKQLNLYYYYKSVLNWCINNKVLTTDIGDFAYLFSKDTVAFTDGIYNGYNYLLVFSTFVTMLTSLGIGVVNTLLISYERECGMLNVMLSNCYDHKKLFSWKYLSSLIASAILFVSLFIVFVSLVGAFSYYYSYISFQYGQDSLVLSTTWFVVSIIFTIVLNVIVFWLFSVSVSFRIKNVFSNIGIQVLLYIMVNCLDTFFYNPFTMASMGGVYLYIGFKVVILVGSILTFILNKKSLTNIDF